jgi:16S rRNA (cytosine1402-N4)-methyltransferase
MKKAQVKFDMPLIPKNQEDGNESRGVDMVVAHQPVMVDEVVRFLITNPGGTYVDGTVGTGGHSLAIAGMLAPAGRLICLDIDRASLARARERLSRCTEKVTLLTEGYADIDTVLKKLGLDRISGVLLDLGVSSYQLESSGRGFSFHRDEPLDMRMDQQKGIPAEELVNTSSVERLQEILWNYGEERWAKRIARAIGEERKKTPIRSTLRLARIVERAIPPRYHPRKIHPATRVFQAIRIAINGELENLADFLQVAPSVLVRHGRLVVISYHSLEDRLVKQAMLQWQGKGMLPRKLPVKQSSGEPIMRAVRKGALRPGRAEIDRNPRARSAVMRVAERV